MDRTGCDEKQMFVILYYLLKKTGIAKIADRSLRHALTACCGLGVVRRLVPVPARKESI